MFKSWVRTIDLYQKGLQESITANAMQRHQHKEYIKAGGVLNKINHQELYRPVIQITDWRQGLESWESKQSPDRSSLHEVYQEIILDPQVAAKVNVAQLRIEASEFQLVDDSGSENSDLTSIFRAEWFSKFIQESLNSDYYGHTLFQFPDSHKEFSFNANDIVIVPRWLVLPNGHYSNGYQGIVVPTPGAQEGVFIEKGRLSKRLLGIGDKNDFGMFSAIAPLYIYKKNAMSYWSGYQQRFGEPTMAIKMETDDNDTHKDYQNFLRNRGTNSGLIMRGEDDATLLTDNTNDPYNIYLNMMTYCDDGISKGLDGNTLTTDSGGGKTKGDVHADVSKVYHLGRLKRLAYAVNDHLIPFLEENYGFDFKGTTFKWKEFKDVDAEVENITKLAANFKINEEEVKLRTGYIVEEQKEDKNVDDRQTNRKTGNDPDDNTKDRRP